MSGLFAAATAVRRLETLDDRVVLGADVQPGWDIGGNANGGYLLAIAGRAMAEAVGRPPLTLTCHYLRPAPPGPCTIEVRPVKAGRRLASASACLSMDGRPVLELVGSFGDQDLAAYEWTREPPVDVPPYEDCVVRDATSAGPAGEFAGRLAVRLRPGDEGFALGARTGDPEIRGWFALAGEEPIDVFGLLLAADAFPPPLFHLDLPTAWVPTVELTVHVRGIPAPGPLRCAFRTRFVRNGLADEEGEIWDSGGRLVAQSRQLAMLPRT